MSTKPIKTLAAIRQRRLEQEREFTEPPCPKCQNPMVQKQGREKPYWRCSSYPVCLYIMLDEDGCPVEREKLHRTHTVCPKCGQGEVIRRRREKRGFYYTCSTYPWCTAFYNSDPREV